jgi:hypothetical protein
MGRHFRGSRSPPSRGHRACGGPRCAHARKTSILRCSQDFGTRLRRRVNASEAIERYAAQHPRGQASYRNVGCDQLRIRGKAYAARTCDKVPVTGDGRPTRKGDRLSRDCSLKTIVLSKETSRPPCGNIPGALNITLRVFKLGRLFTWETHLPSSSWVPKRKLQRSSDLFQEFIKRKPITGAPGPADIAMANDPAQWNVVTLA